MAKGKTIAIWIILVVVLAAAAAVIAIAVQNDKRQKQLSTLEDAAVLYETLNTVKPTPAPASAMAASKMGRPSMRMNTQQHGRQGYHHPQRYNPSLLAAEAHQANQLPPQYGTTSSHMNIGMTSFASPPPPAHMMSTTPMPSSGGGALFVPSKSPQADMPAQQLFVSNNFPSTVETKLEGLTVAPSSVEHVSGTTMNEFLGSAYYQDPAQMTPNTYADGLGLDAYMPNVSSATPDGLDPQTGLPVFSTASLRRSNQLGSRGLQGFLRPTLDDTQGYKHTVGKVLQIGRYTECQLNKRRDQFNAARINCKGEDPMPFNTSDFLYFP